ncbi:MAG: YbaN family protein [Gemmatimonadales bacterium]
MNQDCPIDHDAAERAAERLPDPIRRGVYFAVGSVSVGLGVIGIVVPLWPTTCFLLLAGWCFARSSRRAERWLYENRLFGRYLHDYRVNGVISTRVRHASLVVLWSCIGISAFLLVSRVWAVALLIVVATAVTVHLYSLPTEARPTAAD